MNKGMGKRFSDFVCSMIVSIVISYALLIVWFFAVKYMYGEVHRTVSDYIIVGVVFVLMFCLFYRLIDLIQYKRMKSSNHQVMDKRSYHEVTYRDFINVYPYNVVYKILCDGYWNTHSSKVKILTSVNPDKFTEAVERFLSKDERNFIKALYCNGAEYYTLSKITGRSYEVLKDYERRILYTLSKKRVREYYTTVSYRKFCKVESEYNALRLDYERMLRYQREPVADIDCSFKSSNNMKIYVKNFPVEKLGVSQGVVDCLKSNGINQLEDIVSMDVKTLSGLSGMTLEGFKEIMDVLSSVGLSLRKK